MGRRSRPDPLPRGPSPETAQSLPAPSGWDTLTTGDSVPFGRGTCHSCCAPSTRSLCQGHPQLWRLCRMKELPLSCIPGCPCGSLQALLGCSSVPQPCCRIQPSPEAVSLNIKSSSCWQCWGVGKDSRSNLQLKCVYLRKEVPETCN